MNKLNLNMSDLTFDETRHEYKLYGVIVPSVSEIIKPVSGAFYSGISKEVLEHAADRGTAIHNAIETWIEFQMDTIVDDSHRGYFNAFLKWWDEKKPEPLATECRIYHKILRYAGTADLIAKIDGEIVITDYKNSASVNEKSYSLQLEAYRQAFKSHGIEIEKKLILHLKPDGSWEELWMPNDPKKWLVFNSLKVVRDYIKE